MTVFLYEEVPTDVWGLTFVPNIEKKHPTLCTIVNGVISNVSTSIVSNNSDWIEYGFLEGVLISMQFIHHAVDAGKRDEFTDDNKQVLAHILDGLIEDNEQINILEIGVGRTGNKSSSEVIVNKKRQVDKYIGVDINQNYLTPYTQPDKNQFTCRMDSVKIDPILNFSKEVGVTEFDLIFIDGYHSINQVIMEWRFTRSLKIGGYVGLHDTNYHPGPYCVFEAIDENLFEKTKYCVDIKNDPGISFVRRKKLI